MRAAYRRSRQEEEEESAFVSMTDMTVSFLFIVMILLAFFATQFSEEDRVPRPQYEEVRHERDAARQQRDAALEEVARLKELLRRTESALAEREAEIDRLRQRLDRLEKRDPLEAYLIRAGNAREQVLERLRDQIKAKFPNLQMEISREKDALRFQGEGLFQTGRSELLDRPRRIVEEIASRLQKILKCYTLGAESAWSETCNPGLAIIEAVQIEGHTDTAGDKLYNLRLSTDRANATFAAMLAHESGLTDHLNYRGQPVLSVAGYGLMRPVASNDTREGRATNRRIDLRIIMHTPAGSDEIDRIRERLRGTEPEIPR